MRTNAAEGEQKTNPDKGILRTQDKYQSPRRHRLALRDIGIQE